MNALLKTSWIMAILLRMISLPLFAQEQAVQQAIENAIELSTKQTIQNVQLNSSVRDSTQEKSFIELGDITVERGLISIADIRFLESRIGKNVKVEQEVLIEKVDIKDILIKIGLMEVANTGSSIEASIDVKIESIDADDSVISSGTLLVK